MSNTVNTQPNLSPKEELQNQIISLLEEIDIDTNSLSIKDFINFDELRDYIQQNNLCKQEVIYHSLALEYLRNNDPSLEESLSIASDLGLTCDNLNSETLASLLKTQNCEEAFDNLKSEIEDLFNEINEIEEN